MNDKETIIAFAKEQMDKWELPQRGWSFEFDNRKTSFGVCDHRNKIISLSSFLFDAISMEEKKDTVLHEIAHAMDGITNGRSSGHGRPWRLWCLRVGANPVRCGKTSSDEAREELAKISKYTLVCPNGHKTHSHRKRKRDVSCLRCSGDRTFDERYIFTQIQNY